MKNKMLCLVLSGLLVSQLFSLRAFSQDTVVRVVPSSVTSPRVGEQFTVDIAIENGRNVAGYQVMLHFEYPAIEYVGIQHGEYLPASAFFGEENFIGSHGTVLFAATASPHESNGNGTLATLTFKINEVKPSTFRLSAGVPSKPRHGTILSDKDINLSFPSLENAEMFRGRGASDLVVESPSVSDDTLTPGEEFILSVTVRNKGGGITPLISLYYYRSADERIARSNDTRVGPVEFLSSLGANRSDTQSRKLTAPNSPGIYYYGACVGSYEGEVDADNNCSSAIKITVQESPLKPGLVVQSVSPNKYTVSPGESFRLSAIVANQGTVESDTTTLRFYRSGNNRITTGDTSIRVVTVGGLGLPTGGRSKSTESITLTAATSPGVYYYGACVNRGGNETHCSDAVKITVQLDPSAPDLVVESVRAEPPTVAPGAKFKLYATLKNQGTGQSSATTLRYYSSTNDVISTADKQIGTGSRDPLAKDGTVRRYLEVTAPTEPDTYYYGACVDAVDNESNTGNNCYIDAVSLTVKPPDLLMPPDFISDVAYGADATYFVLNAEFLVPNVANTADLVYKVCTITLNIPGVPDKAVGLTDKANPRLDTPGYFIMPLLTPREKIVKGSDEAAIGLITEIPFTSTILGLGKAVSLIDAGLQATADPKIILTSAKNTRGRPQGKDRYVFFITQRLTDIKLIVEQKYQVVGTFVTGFGPIHTAVYNDTWELEETWKQEGGIAAAPSARPMSLSEYPPFQMLPPEARAYLLQHFGEFANAEAWQIPEETALLSNYPNPFNPETWIPYQLAASTDVTLTIYDIQGRVVRDMDLGHQRAGIYRNKSRAAYWDGRNAQGESVASGVYFYTLTAGDFSATRKLLIRK